MCPIDYWHVDKHWFLKWLKWSMMEGKAMITVAFPPLLYSSCSFTWRIFKKKGNYRIFVLLNNIMCIISLLLFSLNLVWHAGRAWWSTLCYLNNWYSLTTINSFWYSFLGSFTLKRITNLGSIEFEPHLIFILLLLLFIYQIKFLL